MKHTLREILQFFSAGAGHSHEEAVKRTYDEGYAKGKADATAEFQAGLASPSVGTSTEGSASEKAQETAKGQDAEASPTAQSTNTAI